MPGKIGPPPRAAAIMGRGITIEGRQENGGPAREDTDAAAAAAAAANAIGARR